MAEIRRNILAKRQNLPRPHLTNREIIENLRDLLIKVTRNQRSVADDVKYVNLRGLYTRRVRGELPGLVAAHSTLGSFHNFLKNIKDKKERIEIVKDEFSKYIDQYFEFDNKIDSSMWTGRLSYEQKAGLVKRLGPPALVIIDTMLEEFDKRHDNNGPVTQEELDAIAQLRELRTALDGLIKAAEANLPLDRKSQRLRAIGGKALAAMANNIKLDVEAIPSAISSVAVTALTFALSEALGLGEGAVGLLSTAAFTGFAAQRVAAGQVSSVKGSGAGNGG